METDSQSPIPELASNSTSSASPGSQHRHHHHSSNLGQVNSYSAMRNNEVRTVMLYGVPIVALVMDNQERLCLAQISNTLLKNFSYNEIHNRRVALGITCVQCTPVQLELLRRAGAMPVSSRRCGMITKREAERLCKSFLAETAPPKLPDTFAFDIYHHCAWGCRGAFTPSRYNSSRAKCIKCSYCGLFFSPNKFIFHSHRLPESKYVQPDAANFNSWRRHIKLSATPPDDVTYAWEDVKAMFNGGSRKRAMAASLTSISKQQQLRQQTANHSQARDSLNDQLRKRPRLASSSPESSPPAEPSVSPKGPLCGSQAPTYFPLVPMASKSYGSLPVGPTGPAGNPFSPNGLSSHPSAASASAATGSPASVKPTPGAAASDFRQSFAEFMWAGKQPGFQLPYSCLLWPRPPTMMPGFEGPESGLRYKLPPFPLPEGGDSGTFSPHLPERNAFWERQATETGRPAALLSGVQAHSSAFKLVGKGFSSGSDEGKMGSVQSSASAASLGDSVHSIPERINSCSPGQSVQSDDNEVDVIGGGEEDSESAANEHIRRDAEAMVAKGLTGEHSGLAMAAQREVQVLRLCLSLSYPICTVHA
ncbi:SKI family transcriptional corepressor 2 [Halotydeus destructor]|nr:SKI family transcriptional corepressor 2 [Halotydeus destructor]